ncbi:MAG: hypothetical protein FWD88_07640, partial [Treponema sp.]|nr:hypothetical protein [Treponema sp.]
MKGTELMNIGTGRTRLLVRGALALAFAAAFCMLALTGCRMGQENEREAGTYLQLKVIEHAMGRTIVPQWPDVVYYWVVLRNAANTANESGFPRVWDGESPMAVTEGIGLRLTVSAFIPAYTEGGPTCGDEGHNPCASCPSVITPPAAASIVASSPELIVDIVAGQQAIVDDIILFPVVEGTGTGTFRWELSFSSYITGATMRV